MGIAKSTDGIKLHVHTDSASGKAMVSKLGMSKKSKHIELRYLHLQGLVESGVITVHKISTLCNMSDVLTKFMPQFTLSKHFNKIGIAETGIDEVSIQQIRQKLKVSAITCSSTPEVDPRSPPKSRKKSQKDSGASSSQGPFQQTPIQVCYQCRRVDRLTQCEFNSCQHQACPLHRSWIPKDSVSSQWCCDSCKPNALMCHRCQRNGTQVLLFECEAVGCNNHMCGAHSQWSALDQKVRCHPCTTQGHYGPLIRIRGNSSVSISSSSSEPDQSEAEEEERVMEEEIRSQDFIGMLNIRSRDDDSFSLVDQWSSRSPSSEESDNQGRDINQPEVTRVHVRAHQRILQDGRVVRVRSHSRSKGKGRGVTTSPSRVSHPKGRVKGKGRGKSSKSRKGVNESDMPVNSGDEQIADSRPVTV
eukprot:880512-Amphidinium_carterae.1